MFVCACSCLGPSLSSEACLRNVDLVSDCDLTDYISHMVAEAVNTHTHTHTHVLPVELIVRTRNIPYVCVLRTGALWEHDAGVLPGGGGSSAGV